MNTLQKFKDPVVSKEQAIKAAGSKANLARILNVSRATVTEWREIPVHQAYRLVQVFPDLNNA